MMGRAAQTAGVTQVFSIFETSTPQLYLDIDRTKAQLLGVRVQDVFAALQIYIGSSYVNDFNLFGRTYRVTAQADAKYRLHPEDIANLKTRNAAGGMVPLGAVATVRETSGADKIVRYNMYPSAEISGAPIEVGRRPRGIVEAGRYVYVANSGDGTVTRLNRQSGRPAGRPTARAAWCPLRP